MARVLGAHGIRGHVRCEVITDFPERFKRTGRLHLGDPPVAREVEAARVEKRGVVLKLAGVDSRDAAQALQGQLLYVREADAVSLPRESYFWHQVIGLAVRSTQGEDLGTVREIIQTGSNDVYVVRPSTGSGGADRDRELLLPAISDVVRDIDLERGLMTVELIEGLG